MINEGGVGGYGVKWNRYVSALMEAGFTFGEAEHLMCEHLFVQSPQEWVAEALAYREAGFDARETAFWVAMAASVDEAVIFARAGWSGFQFATFARVIAWTQTGIDIHLVNSMPMQWAPLRWLGDRHVAQVREGMNAWMRSGLPPSLVLKFVAAGLAPAEARVAAAQAASGPELVRAIDTLIALGPVKVWLRLVR